MRVEGLWVTIDLALDWRLGGWGSVGLKLEASCECGDCRPKHPTFVRQGALPKTREFGKRIGRVGVVRRMWRREIPPGQEGRCKATWKREFKLPWREAGPPNHHDDEVDSDQ